VQHINRRLFLGASGATAGAIILTNGPASALTRPALGLARATFTPALGGTATVSGQGGAFKAVLTDITDLIGGVKDSQQQFSLLLRPTAPTALLDAIYTVSHPRFGSRSLFLSRVDRGSNLRYQAIVNRVSAAAAPSRPVVNRRHTGVFK
jgi:hypothetical protein